MRDTEWTVLVRCTIPWQCIGRRLASLLNVLSCCLLSSQFCTRLLIPFLQPCTLSVSLYDVARIVVV